MSFLDLESGEVNSNAGTIKTENVQDDENQILYNIITTATDTINLMNRYIQSNNSNISTIITDKKIFDCDNQIMIYNNTPSTEENKTGVRLKLEHDLNDIINNYDPIKRNYYNKKITNANIVSKNNAAASADISYGSLPMALVEENEAQQADQYQSLPIQDSQNAEQRQLLIQEEEEEQLNQQDLDIHSLSVQAHSESVAQIQKHVTEVNQIFHNLNDLIAAQNSKVVTIEDNLNQFQGDVERSEGQLKNAKKELYKRGNCTLVALVAFSIVTLLFVILAI